MPAHHGGTEIYVNALCNSLQKMNVETVILKPGFGNKKITEYKYNNYRIIEYPEALTYDKEQVLGYKPPDGLDNFKEILIKEQPDIIHFHEISGSNGITQFHLDVAKQLGIHIFTTLHLTGYVCKTGTLLYKNKYPCDGKIKAYKCAVCCLNNRKVPSGFSELMAASGLLFQNKKDTAGILPKSIAAILSYPRYINDHEALLRKIFLDSQKVFVLSEWFKKVLLLNSLPENKIVLLKKAIPHQIPAKDSFTKRNHHPNLVRFVYLGRITKIKGLHILLEALNRVTLNNWELDIYGYREEDRYLEHCIQLSANKKDKVFFKGQLPAEQILETLPQYNALVFPTIIQEMVGFVVMEAFAAGIPVIGSDSGGIAEQVTNDVNGILFKPGSTAALSKVLQNILDNPSMLDALKINVKQPRDFSEVSMQVYKAYSDALIPDVTMIK